MHRPGRRAYNDIAGAFFWVTDESENSIEFYIDQIIIDADENAEVNLCNVNCSTITTLEDCSNTGYLACKSACEEVLAGDCSDQALAYQTCIEAEGWTCQRIE